MRPGLPLYPFYFFFSGGQFVFKRRIPEIIPKPLHRKDERGQPAVFLTPLVRLPFRSMFIKPGHQTEKSSLQKMRQLWPGSSAHRIRSLFSHQNQIIGLSSFLF